MDQIKVELQDFMGNDRSIAEAAWTSSLDYEKKQKRTQEDVEKVVKMLAEHKHATPFESVVLRFWIKMPIQTDRQHMTHRIGTHNGLSGRYRTMPSEFLDVPADIKAIERKLSYADNGNCYQRNILDHYSHLCSEVNTFYNEALAHIKENERNKLITNSEYKRFREFLRGVLPQNNMTERITIFNLRSFANYQKLRNSPHAQPEIRRVAELMLEEVKRKNIAPVAIKWLEENNWEL